MSVKERLRILSIIFEEAGINKEVFDKIENKCIAMSHLGFPEWDINSRLNENIKEYLEKYEKDFFNFVNIAEKYDFDLEFLD